MLYGTLEHYTNIYNKKIVGSWSRKKISPPPMDYEKFEIICVKQYVPIVKRKILIGGMGVGGAINRGF